MPSLATIVAAVAFAVVFGLSLPRIGWIAAIMLLAQFSISALNDWADRERDALAARPRPIPLGIVPARAAMAFAIGCAALAFLLEVLAGFDWIALVLLFTGLACGWLYDLALKPVPLSFLPFALAFPLLPVWVGVAGGRPLPSLALLFVAGAPLATAIHLADAIPDRAEDRAAGIRTLAVMLGAPTAEMVAAATLLAGAALLVISSLAHHPLVAAGMVAVGLAGAAAYLRAAEAAAPVAKWLIIGAVLVLVLAWFIIS